MQPCGLGSQVPSVPASGKLPLRAKLKAVCTHLRLASGTMSQDRVCPPRWGLGKAHRCYRGWTARRAPNDSVECPRHLKREVPRAWSHKVSDEEAIRGFHSSPQDILFLVGSTGGSQLLCTQTHNQELRAMSSLGCMLVSVATSAAQYDTFFL